MKQLLIQGVLILATLAWGGETAAFWGNDAELGTSGLDYAKGFDINTVATVKGTIVQSPVDRGQGHAIMDVRTEQGQLNVIMGPWWFWEKNSIPLDKGHEVTITGSKAQGKDGGLYLFAQEITNRSKGHSLTIRSETGVPLWSRADANGADASNRRTGANSRHGGGNRYGSFGGGRGGGGHGGRR